LLEAFRLWLVHSEVIVVALTVGPLAWLK